jgi:hypothetical protein
LAVAAAGVYPDEVGAAMELLAKGHGFIRATNSLNSERLYAAAGCTDSAHVHAPFALQGLKPTKLPLFYGTSKLVPFREDRAPASSFFVAWASRSLRSGRAWLWTFTPVAWASCP